MTTLLELSATLAETAQRFRTRQNAAADHHALDSAREDFEGHHARLEAALGQVMLLRNRGTDVKLPTNGARLAEELRALASRINDDPTAVRDRRQDEDATRGFIDDLCHETNQALSAYVDAARGDANTGLVPSLRKIGLGDAARELQEALDALVPFAERLPASEADLDAVDAAAETIRTVLAEQDTPQYARLRAFMQRTAAPTPLTLDELDAELLAELKAAGAAGNFAIRPIGI